MQSKISALRAVKSFQDHLMPIPAPAESSGAWPACRTSELNLKRYRQKQSS